MSHRILGLLVTTTVLLATGLSLAPATGQNSPSLTALNTFQAIRAAQGSGGNVTSLLRQYNVLLQQSSPDALFLELGIRASNVQQDANALRAYNQTLTLILVPIAALILALASEVLLQLKRKIAREKILSMEITLH